MRVTYKCWQYDLNLTISQLHELSTGVCKGMCMCVCASVYMRIHVCVCAYVYIYVCVCVCECSMQHLQIAHYHELKALIF